MRFLIRIVLLLLSSIPLKVRSLSGRWLGYVAALFPSRERTIAALQLDLFKKQSGGRALVPRVYANAGQVFFESLNLSPLLKIQDQCIRHDNVDLYRRLLDKSEPTILLSAHVSNWDLLAAYTASIGPLATLGREAQREIWQPFLKEMRERHGAKSLWRSDPALIRTLMRELKSGTAIAGLFDQDTDVRSVWVPFFGLRARSPSGLLEIGKRVGARFASVFIVRESMWTYRVLLEEIDRSLSEEEILAHYNKHLEKALHAYPDQWVWFHKRWRTLPDGRKLSSREYIHFLEEKISCASPGF